MAVYTDISDEECRKMLAGNAANLYGFDLDKLAPLAAQYGLSYDEMHSAPGGDDPRVQKLIGDDMDTDAL